MIVQLANTYSPTKNYRVNSWFASPKLDGVRAIFIPGKGLLTRNNKPISGFPLLSEFLSDICNVRGLSIARRIVEAILGGYLTMSINHERRRRLLRLEYDIRDGALMADEAMHCGYFNNDEISDLAEILTSLKDNARKVKRLKGD